MCRSERNVYIRMAGVTGRGCIAKHSFQPIHGIQTPPYECDQPSSSFKAYK